MKALASFLWVVAMVMTILVMYDQLSGGRVMTSLYESYIAPDTRPGRDSRLDEVLQQAREITKEAASGLST